MKENNHRRTESSILTIENTTLAYNIQEPSTHGGLPDYFRKIMQGVSEESIVSLQKNLKRNAQDCDIYTWNFKTWSYNYKVRQTPRHLRLNPKQMVNMNPSDTIKKLVEDLQCERGYFWEEIKNTQDYSDFKSFLIIRWIKLLLAVILTFGIVYALVYFFNIKEEQDGAKQVKADVWFKLGLYACFIPVLIYAYILFGKTESTFLKIFKDLLIARKNSLGQILNKYNREKLNSLGLVAFFDDSGFNFIVGKRESISGYEEVYEPLRDDDISLLTGDDLRTYNGIGEDGEYVEVYNSHKL